MMLFPCLLYITYVTLIIGKKQIIASRQAMMNRLSYVFLSIFSFTILMFFTNQDVHAEVNGEALEQEVS